MVMLHPKKDREYANRDKLQYVVVSALEYYKGTLETLVADQVLVPTETDMFENYLENAINEAAIAATEIRAEPRNISDVYYTSAFKHKIIVREALIHYIRGLQKSEKTIFEKIGENSVSERVAHYYHEQQRIAESLLFRD
jgi:hypothetical protein